MTTFVFGPAVGNSGPFARVAALDETEARRRVQLVNTQRDWTDKVTVRAWVIRNANFASAGVTVADRVEKLI